MARLAEPLKGALGGCRPQTPPALSRPLSPLPSPHPSSTGPEYPERILGAIIGVVGAARAEGDYYYYFHYYFVY